MWLRATARSRRLARWVLFAEGAFTAAIVTFAGIGIPLYVFPVTDQLTHADAVFVLGPPSAPRVAYAEKLMQEGYADHLVLSTKPTDSRSPYVAACNDELPYPVDCFVAQPNTTQGEAEALKSMAEKNGWNTVIVVTFQSHITRARILMQRCYGGTLEMAAAPRRYSVTDWIREYLYQSAAFVKVAAVTAC